MLPGTLKKLADESDNASSYLKDSPNGLHALANRLVIWYSDYASGTAGGLMRNVCPKIVCTTSRSPDAGEQVWAWLTHIKLKRRGKE